MSFCLFVCRRMFVCAECTVAYIMLLKPFMQVLVKIINNKNLFNKVMSFCLRFVAKCHFDCEQVEQQTSQTELKQCLSCSTFRNHAFTHTMYFFRLQRFGIWRNGRTPIFRGWYPQTTLCGRDYSIPHSWSSAWPCMACRLPGTTVLGTRPSCPLRELWCPTGHLCHSKNKLLAPPLRVVLVI